ncbi:MAG: hypothetical protein QM817_32290 [Archangium sp.]
MRLHFAVLVVVFAGCGVGGGADDGGSPATDAGITNTFDAGQPDAGLVDAGVVDAGVPDAGIVDSGIPHVVLGCSGLADAGVWEELTPPAARSDVSTNCYYGGSFVVDPTDRRNVFLGSCQAGIFKSTDCGATWTKVSTGRHSIDINSGRQWTMAIDPTNPQILYANSGYNLHDGNNSTLYKSINGGVDWDQIWPPANAMGVPGFVGGVQMDPTDSQHLLLGMHAACGAPHANACFGESLNGGMTWRIVDGEASWNGGEGSTVSFLGNSDTWIFKSETNGLWRTTNRGQSWTFISGGIAHGTGDLVHTSAGTFIQATSNGVLRSSDGIMWSAVQNSGNLVNGMTVIEGTTIVSSRGFPWNPGGNPQPYQPFLISRDDGLTWSTLPSPMLNNAGQLSFDPDHRILYTSNLNAGFWRVVLP